MFFQATDNAGLRLLAQRNAGLHRPAPHCPIPSARPGQAGLFMHMDGLDPVAAVQVRQHVQRIARAHDKPRAPRRQRFVEFGQGFHQEIELAAGMFRQRPEARFEDVKRQHGRPARHGGGEGRMVMHPQIATEPDEMNTIHGTKIEHSRSSDKRIVFGWIFMGQ